MKKRGYSALGIIGRVYRHTLRAVPFSGVTGVANYLAQGFLPGVTALLLAKLFDAANLLAQGEGRAEELAWYGGLFVGSYAVVYLLQLISSITINAGIYERCTSYYKMKISEKMAALPLLAFEDAELLNLQSRARDCAGREILSQIYMASTVFLTKGLSVVMTISVLASYHPAFVPISLLSVLPYLIMRILRGREFYQLKRAQAKKARRAAYLWSLFHNKQAIKEMRVMGFGDYLSGKWTETRDEVNEDIWKQNIRDGRSMLFCDALKIAGYGCSILFALLLAMEGQISIGVFGACIAAFQSMQNAARDFFVDLGNLPEKISFARDYFMFLDLPEEKNGARRISGLKDDITLSNVSFAYPGSARCALKNISFTIKNREKLVILGVNGSGKTTLSKLLLHVYEPSQGEIRYGGITSAELETHSFYTYASMVPQNFVSYHLSLRENIAISDLGRLQDDASILKSLESVGLQELANQAEGLDVQLGREFGGLELSGGQWQKIAIARGIFKDSDLIVLDEPTSALDPLIETEILKQFLEIAKNKTAVIISHRVGLCKLADRILLMKDGEICEMGSHQELMKKGGEYKRLYMEQEQWYR